MDSAKGISDSEKHLEDIKKINVSSEHKLNKMLKNYEHDEDQVEMGDVAEINQLKSLKTD